MSSEQQPTETPTPEVTPTPSGITVPPGLVAACAEAVEELKASRKLLESQGVLIERQQEMIKLEVEIAGLGKTINELSGKQIEQLKIALSLKDRVITAAEAEIAVLKKQRMTFWKKTKYFVIGAAAGIVIGAVALK